MLLCKEESEEQTSGESKSDIPLPLFLASLAVANGFPGLSTERTNELPHGRSGFGIDLRAQEDDISKSGWASESVAPRIKALVVHRSSAGHEMEEGCAKGKKIGLNRNGSIATNLRSPVPRCSTTRWGKEDAKPEAVAGGIAEPEVTILGHEDVVGLIVAMRTASLMKVGE
jgi:hypothetical protein